MPRHRDDERNEVMSQTRRLLLDAATDEFGREGYHGANINRISRAAGFAKGTIYNYFDSKGDLLIGMISQARQGSDRKLKGTGKRPHPAPCSLRRECRAGDFSLLD